MPIKKADAPHIPAASNTGKCVDTNGPFILTKAIMRPAIPKIESEIPQILPSIHVFLVVNDFKTRKLVPGTP